MTGRVFWAVGARLVETGNWLTIDRRDDLLNFWRQPSPAGNDPADYITVTGRSRALVDFIADIDKGARILEVGCNVGRNLAYLYDHGWMNVEGVEISPYAVDLLRRTYPQLAEQTIHVGPAEDVLSTFPDRAFDLVFTMAVLEHIHPSSVDVFDNISRIAKVIAAFEPVGHRSHRQYPHNIPDLFRHRGRRLIREIPVSSLPGGNERDISWYTAYRFE